MTDYEAGREAAEDAIDSRDCSLAMLATVGCWPGNGEEWKQGYLDRIQEEIDNGGDDEDD